MAGRDWSDDELRYVVECRAYGMSFPEIAENLPGRSAKSCNVMLNRCARESDQYEVPCQSEGQGLE